jgi:cell division protein FtsW
MSLGKRGSNSIARWFWTIDNISLFLLVAIMCFGAILITSASPAVAERVKLSSFYFVHRQLLFLGASLFIIIFFSLLSEKSLRQIALIGFVTCVLLLVGVLFFGDEVKGARRWINILGFNLQPSEFLKPFYIFITGLILSERYNRDDFPAFTSSLILHSVIVILLILQPDFGMVVTFTTVLAGQFFLAGIPLWIIFVIGFAAVAGAFAAYILLPHVARRIDLFLNSEGTENYQVDKSLEAYINGGLFGRGPGEGTVKAHIPDSHADFIFAVAGEEFGSIFCTIILLLFLAFIVRAIFQITKLDNLFKIYATAGIIMLFTLQTTFNIGVTLHLFPTKGMTLPFISYGGSSALSFAIAFGMLLNLTKKYYNITNNVDKLLLNRQ